jgi:hypothetical protein
MRKLEFSDLSAQPGPTGGYQDPVEVAREKAAWILENHHPQPLMEAQQVELRRVIDAASREFGTL